jgi:hypothetical protein
MTDEEIRDYLLDNGYPPHIVRGGRQGLVNRWRTFVSEVEQGYEFGLEDYRNDLDIRGVLRLIEADEEVIEADLRLRDLLVHTEQRVWESTDGDPWWDFGFPSNARSDLLRDLRAEGLAE